MKLEKSKSFYDALLMANHEINCHETIRIIDVLMTLFRMEGIKFITK